jgi:four helix bundle protein
MLRIHEVAIELVGDVMPLVERIERKDPDLARQARRAVSSAPLNIAEGSDQVGKRRNLHYRIAIGSARETLSALRVAVAARYIEPLPEQITHKFDHVIGTLHRCVCPRK